MSYNPKVLYKRLLNASPSSKELLTQSSKVTIVRVLGLLASMLVSIVFGNILGAEGLGMINLANQLINVLGVIALLGIPTVVLKEVSIAKERGDGAKVNATVITSAAIVVAAGILLAGFLFLFSSVLAENIFEEKNLITPLKILSFGILFQLIARIFAAGVNGLGKVWQSSLADKNMMTFAIILVLTLFFSLQGYKIDVVTAAFFYLGARGLVALGIAIYWNYLQPLSKVIDFTPKAIILVGLPLLVANATTILTSSTDTLMLGGFSELEEVGYYTVANRIAFSFSIFLPIANSTIAPKLAPMFASGKIKEMERMVQGVTKVTFAIGFFSVLFIILFGKYLLLLWGNGFDAAYWMLVVLGIGQFVNVSTGSVALLLMICNQEKVYGRVTVASSIVNVFLNFIFIKYYDGLGASIATAITMILVNILNLYLVKKTLGIKVISL